MDCDLFGLTSLVINNCHYPASIENLWLIDWIDRSIGKFLWPMWHPLLVDHSYLGSSGFKNENKMKEMHICRTGILSKHCIKNFLLLCTVQTAQAKVSDKIVLAVVSESVHSKYCTKKRFGKTL